MKIKKLFQTAVLFSFVSVSVFAMEWGGTLKNDTGVSLPGFNSTTFTQSDSVYLWTNVPLTKNGMVYFAAEGMYKFSMSKPSSDSATITNLADLDLFKIAGDWETKSGILSLSAGRFIVVDSTGVLFSQLSDGISVKYSSAMFNVASYVGYTGLLNGLNVSMLDENGMSYFFDKKVYALGHSYLPLSMTLEFPALIGNQAISLQTNGFIDLKPESVNSVNSNGSRFYESLILSGPITNSLFYSAVDILGTMDFKKLMNYASVDLYFYPLNFMSLTFGCESASSSGKTFDKFVTFTSRSISNASNYPETSGVIVPKMGASFLFENAYVGLVTKMIMADVDSSMKSKGIEVDLSGAINLFSDFQVSCSMANYFDISGNKAENNMTATVSVAIAF